MCIEREREKESNSSNSYIVDNVRVDWVPISLYPETSIDPAISCGSERLLCPPKNGMNLDNGEIN